MKKIGRFFSKLGTAFKRFGISVKERLSYTKDCYQNSNGKVRSSVFLMGLGQLRYKQIAKGLIYLFIEIGFILFMVLAGGNMIKGFFTLGTKESDAWRGIAGDDSVIFMLLGIFAWIIIILFIILYISNIKDAYRTYRDEVSGKPVRKFKEELKDLLDKKFYKTVLFLPIIGVSIFSVLPIVFMVLIAFTNYGGTIVPPKLVDWSGFQSFAKIFSLSALGNTFIKILIWNIAWAVISTAVNYFLGLGLALLLNKKCVKWRAFWRAFPILAYAIPGFITLLGFKFMFSMGGPINYYLEEAGHARIGFLDIDATWSSRFIGLFVNAWLTVPTTMLLATGILSNMNTDLYEAASIDGASKRKQFWTITLPFVIFSTTPSLISQFIGNFNNFGIFYFLREERTSPGYEMASDTDLLINWLYRLSMSNNLYNIAAAISLIMFAITSGIALLVYIKSPAYRKEDTFR